MIRIVLLFVIGINFHSFSQKIIERDIEASTISKIIINSDLIYKINIKTEKTTELKIKTHINGENYEHVLLSIQQENQILTVRPEYAPFFKRINDKLAAHKLIAIEIELRVPERMKLNINSKLASVSLKGKIYAIEAILEKGNCILNDFQGNAFVKTMQGFIEIYTNKKAIGVAKSSSGLVINELIKKENPNIIAESSKGNVYLYLIE